MEIYFFILRFVGSVTIFPYMLTYMYCDTNIVHAIISFFKGWLNFSSLKVLELLPAKARHNFFEILKLYIKLYIVQAEKQTMMPQAV